MCCQSWYCSSSFGFVPIALSVVEAFTDAQSVYVGAGSCHSVIPADLHIHLSLLIHCSDHMSVLISLGRNFGHILDLLNLFYDSSSFLDLP